jgi:plasmid stabilization system protein ParE
VRWTQEALRWLREIRDYIARDILEAARSTAAGIVDRVEVLSSFPEIGQRYEGVTEREIRILLYGHYRIAYLVTSERDVKLLGIFHGALDIDRYLG